MFDSIISAVVKKIVVFVANRVVFDNVVAVPRNMRQASVGDVRYIVQNNPAADLRHPSRMFFLSAQSCLR